MGKRVSIFGGVVLVFLLLSVSSTAQTIGGDFTYQWVGQDSLLVRLNMYRTCNQLSAPASVSVDLLNCVSISRVVLYQTDTVNPQQYLSGTELTPLCPDSIMASTCNGGSVLGIKHYQYEAIIADSNWCQFVMLSYRENSRSTLINNLANPQGTGFFIEVGLYTQSRTNSSPVFGNQSIPYLCAQEQAYYSHAVFDAEGDSIVFKHIAPIYGGQTSVAYAQGYSLAEPVQSGGSFMFDEVGGQYTLTPSIGQVSVVVIRVEEYRNGSLLGFTMREVPFVVQDAALCNTLQGTINNQLGTPLALAGGWLREPYHLVACPGDTLRFQLGVKSSNQFLFNNFDSVFPLGSTLVTAVGPDSFVVSLTMPVTNADLGTKTFSIGYATDDCPLNKYAFKNFKIEVNEGIDAGSDTSYCIGGLPAALRASGSNTYTWQPATGLSNPNIPNPSVSPNTTTIYTVEGNLTGACRNIDTVVVGVVPAFTYVFQPVTDTVSICTNNLTRLSISPDTAFSPYRYLWRENGLPFTDTTASITVSPDSSSSYSVSISAANGCVLQDSVYINITGIGPKVIVLPDAASICNNTSVQLEGFVVPFECGLAGSGSNYCSGAQPTPTTIGSGNDTSIITPFVGQYTSGKFQALYKASDLRAMGMKPGTISKLELTVSIKRSTLPYYDFTIKLGCTDDDNLIASYLPLNTVEVFYDSSYTTVAGTNLFELSQPYNWDGVSNIILEVCFGGTSNVNHGGRDDVFANLTNYNAANLSFANFATNICNNGQSSATISNKLPQITFYSCEATLPSYTYLWSPTVGLGSTTLSNTTATPQQSTAYTLTVAEGGCTGQDAVDIGVTNFTVSLPNDTTICQGNSIQLPLNVNGIFQSVNGHNGNTVNGPVTNVIVGNVNSYNTSTTAYPAPYGHYWESAKQHYLYTASDLTSFGLGAGRITALAFNIAVLNGVTTYYDFSIRIKATSTSSLDPYVFETGAFVDVFFPKAINFNTLGWNTHQFDRAFDWDGQSNLIVEVCFDNHLHYASFSSNSPVFTGSTGYLSYVAHRNDNESSCSSVIVENRGYVRPDIRFSVSPPGPPYTVSWQPTNGVSDPSAYEPYFAPTSTTTYTATVTSYDGCSQTDSVTVSVSYSGNPRLIISASSTCVGASSTTITASIIGGAIADPVYEWKRNGVIVGGNTATLVLSGLGTSDVVTCSVRPSLACTPAFVVVSNPLTFGTANSAAASVSIASQPAVVCDRDVNITFTAVPANGGTAPIYQWFLNGTLVGNNSPLYSVQQLSANDRVTCYMISSLPCLSVGSDTSNAITVFGSQTASITISAGNRVCPGTETFTANVLNAGANVGLQWTVNGNAIAGSGNTVTISQLNAGDTVRCVLTAQEPCVVNSPLLSNALVVEQCVGISTVLAESLGFSVAPNPSSAVFNIRIDGRMDAEYDLAVYDLAGKRLQYLSFDGISYSLDLSTYGKGVYVLKISDGLQVGYKRIVLQ